MSKNYYGLEEDINIKKKRLELALYNWLIEIDKVKTDITQLLENNDIQKSKIAKDIDTMQNKLMTIKHNLKTY